MNPLTAFTRSPVMHSSQLIIDILLRTRAAMHTTIAAAAVWQFEASILILTQTVSDVELTSVQVSKQGCVLITREHWTRWCQRAIPKRFLYSLIIISIFLVCCHVAKNEKLCFCGAPFLWKPLFGRTCWTCPKSASGSKPQSKFDMGTVGGREEQGHRGQLPCLSLALPMV